MIGEKVQGRRLMASTLHAQGRFEEGDYGRVAEEWLARPPGSNLGSLVNHEVTEHEDGTITVSPSILIHHPPDEPWHGYLRRGVWERVS